MRYRMFLAVAAAVFLAGCSSSRRAPGVGYLEPMAPAPVVARTQTVTARPVAKTIEATGKTHAFMPPPAPEISEDSTLPVDVLRPAGRLGVDTEIRPASRPARLPAIATADKPIAPISAPCVEACPGGVCGIPDPCDPCDPCAGGNCGIPSPCDVINFLKKRR